MNYRLNKKTLLESLAQWNKFLKKKVHLIACGGTALTLLDIKPSTKDVDLLIPDEAEYRYLIKTLQDLGYRKTGGYGWRREEEVLTFDLFPGKRIHTTELLDSPLKEGGHHPFKELTHLYIGILNYYDLIASKLFRGTTVDFEDRIMLLMARRDEIDLGRLKEHFKELASYDVAENRIMGHLDSFLMRVKKEKKIMPDKPDKQLLADLAQLGFPLVETAQEELDVNKTLAEVVQSGDTRLWEGFPVLLANATERPGFDYGRVEQYLADHGHRQQFKNLFLLALALYEDLDLKFAWAAQWRGKAAKDDVLKVKSFQKQLAGNKPVEVSGRQLLPQRLKDLFADYYGAQAADTGLFGDKQAALSLEYALSQLFSPKQKELFYKKLKGETMTKTEREYYSRSVKKKVQALANSQLHNLALRLLE